MNEFKLLTIFLLYLFQYLKTKIYPYLFSSGFASKLHYTHSILYIIYILNIIYDVYIYTWMFASLYSFLFRHFFSFYFTLSLSFRVELNSRLSVRYPRTCFASFLSIYILLSSSLVYIHTHIFRFVAAYMSVTRPRIIT